MSEDLTKKLPRSDSEEILNLILTRLQRLEQRVEERLYDTRPMWDKVIADIAQLQEGQNRMEVQVGEIKTSLRDASRRMSVFHDTLLSMQADYRHIYDRVRGLEVNRNQQNSST